MDIKFMLNRGGLWLTKHSPEILMGVGFAGSVATGFALHKALVEARRMVKETEDRVAEIRKGLGNFHDVEAIQNEMTRQVGEEYLALIENLLKLFGPVLALGIISGGCLLKSNRILNKRNAGLAAAYKIIDDAFKRYRQAVVDKYGEEEDRNFRRGVKSEKVSDENPEPGKEIEVVEQEEPIDYARWFTPANPLFTRDTTTNIRQLLTIQAYCNDMLRIRGHFFLNEVYDQLGFPRTNYGQEVGWMYDSKKGDGIIDFRIQDPIERSREEIEDNPYTPPSIFLDFNVEGLILNEI